METFKIVVFYLLLLDSAIVNILAWGRNGWYVRHFRTFSRYVPITKVWGLWYIILVAWVGFLTF
ncbi:hypothetical protein COU49_02645 [Candidatus Nomurabacteria bacterium CG10_big_fil_rev_8_21_14_0_10_35_16]|uniref:Uncharacterized protein n=1 Tax=Candidatus Nomurabacteria bacterium CG10_big_fil_rev_8_21_14_0_10_35_16 TaxID=1974731 RepID=A0A2H0TB60_9BACT|nr:MAG: hypothetical protein COU49_02645 [Candidatus Nomurabacteria bacterium CG10_big_fil_rev_8_21_14_0_10_35_16]